MKTDFTEESPCLQIFFSLRTVQEVTPTLARDTDYGMCSERQAAGCPTKGTVCCSPQPAATCLGRRHGATPRTAQPIRENSLPLISFSSQSGAVCPDSSPDSRCGLPSWLRVRAASRPPHRKHCPWGLASNTSSWPSSAKKKSPFVPKPQP